MYSLGRTFSDLPMMASGPNDGAPHFHDPSCSIEAFECINGHRFKVETGLCRSATMGMSRRRSSRAALAFQAATRVVMEVRSSRPGGGSGQRAVSVIGTEHNNWLIGQVALASSAQR